ncbi:13769_t:CDS:2, partial [Funneliformis geosporum]
FFHALLEWIKGASFCSMVGYGKSHTCYFREEENDPTQLRPLYPGKLVRCLVESGDHVKRDIVRSSILKAAVIDSHYGDDGYDGYDYRSPSYDSLKELIDTRFAVFVVLPNSFYHQDSWVGLAVLEVYA